ncbi:MAG: SDR family NAD(P)-dependent oxidoreductase, partial [Polyangiaceae bacterium]
MSEERELDGKAAVVTGAARNMGRAFAVALAKRGADVVVHHHGASSKADAEETARLVRDAGKKALVVDGDIASVAAVQRLFDETMKAFGRVDIVVNNAGVIVKKPFVEITEEDFDRSFTI